MIDCPHCQQTGTCKNARDEKSCGTCLKKAKINNEVSVVRCAICSGSGKIDSVQDKFNTGLSFAVAILVLASFLVLTTNSIFKGVKLDSIIPLVSTLTTMIVTFYFAKKK